VIRRFRRRKRSRCSAGCARACWLSTSARATILPESSRAPRMLDLRHRNSRVPSDATRPPRQPHQPNAPSRSVVAQARQHAVGRPEIRTRETSRPNLTEAATYGDATPSPATATRHRDREPHLEFVPCVATDTAQASTHQPSPSHSASTDSRHSHTTHLRPPFVQTSRPLAADTGDFRENEGTASHSP
jgi:hypothetical protein